MSMTAAAPLTTALPATRSRPLRLFIALLTGLVAGLVPVAVEAGTYPPGGPTITTDQGVYSTGEQIVIVAEGFEACIGETLTFTITPPGGGAPITVTAVIGPDGTATFTLPGQTVEGVYTVSAVCDGVTVTTTFRVVGDIVDTGSNVARPLLVAATLIGGGLLLVVVASKRRRLSHPLG